MGNYLFSGISWYEYEQNMAQRLGEEIAEFNADRLLDTSPDALTDFYIDKYSLETPALLEDQISFENREADINMRHDNRLNRFGGYGPSTVKGEEYEFHIPFTGNAALFSVQPVQFSYSPPDAVVDKQMLVYRICGVSLTNDKVTQSVERLVVELKEYLSSLGASVSNWNHHLRNAASTLINDRRDKLIAQRTGAANLKYKMRTRPGASQTYAAPVIRRKLAPTMPPPSKTPWKPEPVLEEAEYEHILSVITQAARTWEFSPGAFGSMGEEDLRTQFLFQLNGHYDSQATGETFNKSGKTDILIRQNGRNIFIGECKFWGGAKVLTETIDQILGYTSWRDTKVAVIIFNRNKNFTNVLEQIQETVSAHPNFLRSIKRCSESEFGFKFHNNDDERRELTLTVLAFDVPQPD